jgi:hypothetical protein
MWMKYEYCSPSISEFCLNDIFKCKTYLSTGVLQFHPGQKYLKTLKENNKYFDNKHRGVVFRQIAILHNIEED